jgi:hypothetical protein
MISLISKAAFGAAMLLGGSPAEAADSREDWQGYDWRTVERATCPELGADAPCQLFHGKWDWKRNQWVDLVLGYSNGALELTSILTNYDRRDDDNVCTVVLFQDSAGANVAAFHFNEHSDPQTARNDSKRFPIPRDELAPVSQIRVGTKQCREGPQQDKATYTRVLDAMKPR